jgi:Ca-activated chloride channel family protein
VQVLLDRLLLWLIVLAPLVSMLAVAAALNWNGAGRKYRKKIVLAAAIGLALLSAAFVRMSLLNQDAYVHFQNPWLLLAAIPVLGFLLRMQFHSLSGISRGRQWAAYILRASIFNLILLALAGLQMVRERDDLSVLFALDCSKSVPESERQRAIEFIRRTLPEKPAKDEAGLLVFGGNALLESPLSPLFSPPDARNFKSVVRSDATDIAQALRMAEAHLSSNSRRRIVLFTDGGQTSGDATDALKRVTSSGTDVWIAPLAQSNGAEMLIDKIVVPNELLWEQPFDAHVFVYSNVSAQARVHLYLDDKPGDDEPPSRTQRVDLLPGKNRVTFPALHLHSGGAKQIRAVLEPFRAIDDTLSENNEAYAFTDVQTDNRVLVLTGEETEVKYLLSALEDQKMTVEVCSGAKLPENPEAYRAYDCIVLANLPRGMLSEQQMESINSCVEDQGAGLVMIGGDQSFGAGGYLGTPVEKALPVNMDLLNGRAQPNCALVIVIDNSGSMGQYAGASTKQELAAKAAAAAIAPLTPKDYVGVVSFDEEAHVVADLSANASSEQCRRKIRSIEPGGGTNIYSGLNKAVEMFENLPADAAALRHVILLTDGEGSGGDVEALARKLAARHVTLTTIGVGNDADGRLLERLAKAGGGRYLPVSDPRKLPQVMLKETAILCNNLIHSDERGIPVHVGVVGPTLKDFTEQIPDVRAFVLTAPKPLSEIQLYSTVNGEKYPILSSWQHGLGKAIAFTSDAGARWAPQWTEWGAYKKFWVNTLLWASRQHMPANMTITTRLDGNTAHVVVESIDAKGNYASFEKLRGNVTAPATRSGDDAGARDLSFELTAPGRYEATFTADKPGSYAVTVVDMSDVKRPRAAVTGLSRSYSAEFAMQKGGERLLNQLGDIATGKNTVSRLKNIAKLHPRECGLFNHDLPPAREARDLFWPLLTIALCLFPLDVAIRRLALDPEQAFVYTTGKMKPLIHTLRSSFPVAEPARPMQERYEQAGSPSAAQNFSGNPDAENLRPFVGGTKITPPDEHASEYTRSLLDAKKRAKKK